MVCYKTIDTYMNEPTKEQLDFAKNEIGEVEDRLENLEQLIYDWFNTQKHLPKNYDKRMVRNFIRSCKHNLIRAQTRLENYYAAKSIYTEIFSNRNPTSNDVVSTINNVNVVILPKLNEKGERLIYLSLENLDVEVFNMASAMKLFYMLYDLHLTTKHTVCGEIVIIDSKGFTPNHFVKLFSMMKIQSIIARNAYAIRLKRIYVINAPVMIEKCIASCKPFLHKRIRESFTVLRDDNLFEFFPAELLPSNYNGKLNSLRDYMKEAQELLIANIDWYKEQENCKIIGSFTPSCLDSLEKYDNDAFGVQGSFRKLQID